MTPAKSRFKPDREREYKLFLVWQIAPQEVRDLGIAYLEQEGITDPYINEIAGIKTQKAFAEKYGLDEKTLWNWKQQEPPEEYKELADFRYYSKQLIKNVMPILYRGFKERKDPASAKFLMEAHGEYIQKSEVKIDGTQELFDNVRIILESVKGGDNEHSG